MPRKIAEYEYLGVGAPWGHEITLAPIIHALIAIPPDGSILDIGCGNGAILAEIRRHGNWTLCGVDSSESGVSIARSQGLEVKRADATADLTALYEPHSFDLIICAEVIEHVYDPRGLLGKAARLLRVDGTFVLTTPYHGYLKNLAIALLGKSDVHYDPLLDCGHIKFWSRKTLSAVLDESGFRIIHFYGAGRVPYLWKRMVLTAVPKTAGIVQT